MGETFRRYWLPAALSSELPEPDGAPVRVRLLGEDLIAFRDSSGAVGLVDAFCPHRRAPMFFGRNEECGLRCVYHGWKFDRHGTCVDMPSEPPDSLFKTKVGIRSYPTWEGGGYIWTYLGPPETQPAPPDFELVRAPETHRHVSKMFENCNWLQALEGGMDTTHTHFLHKENAGDLTYMDDFAGTVPALDVYVTDYGYLYTGIRDVGGRQWVRGIHYLMPCLQMRGDVEGFTKWPDAVPKIDGHLWVPIDDEHTWVYNFMYACDPARPIGHDQFVRFEYMAGRGPDDYAGEFRLKKSLANDYHIDRAAQKHENFTGIVGVNTQDFAVQEGMGPIVDRSREHLGTTDRAVIALRKLLLEATDAVAAGKTPRGADPAASRTIRAVDHFIPAGADWRVALAAELTARY
jgi:phenylpropionate dioxygenase-like ring-hydroxylating dioxygenase large terminal subunit